MSRGAFKLNARTTSAIHTAAERAAAFALAYNRPQNLNRTKLREQLFPAWDAVGIVQHHDSMTGTMSALGTYTAWGSSDRNETRLTESLCTEDKPECQCLEDYTKRLAKATSASKSILAAALGIEHNDVQSTHVTVFNPLAKNRATTVAVSLKGIESPGENGVGVIDNEGKELHSQLAFTNDTIYVEVDVKALNSVSFDLVSPCSSGCAAVPTSYSGAMDLKNGHGTSVTFADNTGLPATINGIAAHHRYGQYVISCTIDKVH